MNEVVPLSSVCTGTVAEIDEICGRNSLVERLHEMGFCQGSRVQMVRQGRPCIVKLCGSKICFRDNEATCVMVRVCPRV